MLEDMDFEYFYRSKTTRLGVKPRLVNDNTFFLKPIQDHELLEKTDVDFVSDEIKFFLLGQTAFFHMLLECVAHITRLHDKFKEKLYVVVDLNGADKVHELLKDDLKNNYIQSVNSVGMLISFLEKYKIKYSFIHTGHENVIANNCYVIHRASSLTSNVNILREYSQKGFSKSYNNDPFRKVYLSRSHMPKVNDPHRPEALNYRSFYGKSTYGESRMSDEQKLENFLSTKYGFEIVNPEFFFNDIGEQIDYMSSVKTLASLTSSGLANMSFMNKNTNIFEFATPISQASFEEYHVHYQHMADILGQEYYCISHSRKANDIINAIQSNPILDKVLRE